MKDRKFRGTDSNRGVLCVLRVLTHLERCDVVWQFVADGGLNVHDVILPEQVSQLLFVLVDHLDNPEEFHKLTLTPLSGLIITTAQKKKTIPFHI